MVPGAAARETQGFARAAALLAGAAANRDPDTIVAATEALKAALAAAGLARQG